MADPSASGVTSSPIASPTLPTTAGAKAAPTFVMPGVMPSTPTPGVPMSVASAPTIASIKDALKNTGNVVFYDAGYKVSSELRTAVESRIQELSAKTKGRIVIVAVPPKTNVEVYKDLYGQLGMGGQDLFVVFTNGMRHLNFKPLGKQGAVDTLGVTKALFQRDTKAGLLAVFDEIDSRITSGKTVAVAPVNSLAGGNGKETRAPSRSFEIFLAIAAVVIVVVVLFRRRQRDAHYGEEMKSKVEAAKKELTTLEDMIVKAPNSDDTKRAAARRSTLETLLVDLEKQGASRETVERLTALVEELKRVRSRLRDATVEAAAGGPS